MSGMSEYLDALKFSTQAFSEGMKSLGTGLAVKDAKSQLDQANATLKSDEEKQAAAAKIGQGLAMRLTAAGADAGQISAATAGLTPSASMQSQNAASMKVEKMKTEAELKKAQMNNETALAIAGIKTDSAQKIADKKLTPNFDAEVKNFASQPQIKPILQGLPRINDALQMITDNKGDFGVTAMVNLAKLGLIRNAAGRVNEKEIVASDESPSARAKLWKEMGLQSSGEVPAKVQDFWQGVLQKSKENSYKQLQEGAKGHAARVGITHPGTDTSVLEKAIHQQYGIPDAAPPPSSNPNQAKIQAAEAALSDPANKDHPRRAELEQQLQKWKAGQ